MVFLILYAGIHRLDEVHCLHFLLKEGTDPALAEGMVHHAILCITVCDIHH